MEELESKQALDASVVETAPVVANPPIDPVDVGTKTLASKSMDWTFLKSTAFYAVLIASASAVLLDPSFPTNKWYANLGKGLGLIAAGFWTTRTIDRVTDKATQ